LSGFEHRLRPYDFYIPPEVFIVKISLEREALLRQLQTVSRVASTRSAIQALSGVQLVAASSGCELLATDMDVGLRVPVEAEVVREGVVVLPARLLLDVVRLLPAQQVSLELRPQEQDVELVSGNATFHIRTLRAEDFPPFPEPEPDSAVSLPVEAFVSTALKVANSASRDETRPVLTGILVSASDKELRMVATDSYRLSVKETVLEAALPSGFEVNVPARALQELARVAGHTEDEQLRISVRQNQVVQAISAWAAIIAVPTFFASIWGMNFDHMPELGLRFGYPLALLVMLSATLLLYRFFKRIQWL